MFSLVFPPDESGPLAVLRGYFDESYGDKNLRVYAIGGYVGYERAWKPVARNWKNRRLRDGVPFFHAADCEGGFGDDYKRLSKEKRTQLKTDLIEILAEEKRLGGFSCAVLIDDFHKVRDSSDRAKKVLGPSPYFLCFQTVFSTICAQMENAGVNARVAYVFEEQEEFSGRAKNLYDQFKKINTVSAPRMGTLTYASKTSFVPLEIADNLAYETMKEILNHTFDPERPRRIAMQKMWPQIRQISFWTEPSIRKLVENVRTESDILGVHG